MFFFVCMLFIWGLVIVLRGGVGGILFVMCIRILMFVLSSFIVFNVGSLKRLFLLELDLVVEIVFLLLVRSWGFVDGMGGGGSL